LPTVRVRFAPSPTGYLHVGGLRTALYNFLFARRNNGVFVLRIEDTDRARYVEGAVENLIQTLHWAGLEIDEGPYFQSQRLAIYKEHVEGLLRGGNAYYAFETPEELEEMRKMQEKSGAQKHFRRALSMTPSEVQEKLDAGVPAVVRMKVPDGEIVALDDVVRGRVQFSSDLLDDQVILKSDGYPTYHLANVVDDHLMGITHVIRGEEWLSSTPKHVLLYKYFGWEPPVFAHLPLLLNPDKSKLSKRQGDVAVEEYRAKGYFPEALVNFVALLGWNPGTEQEIFSLKDLIQEFSLERVGKAGAVFNIEKLNWMNTAHLRSRSDGELLTMLRPVLERSGRTGLSDAYLLSMIGLMKERVDRLEDFATNAGYFFEDPETYDEQSLKKNWKPGTGAHLREVRSRLSQVEAFDHAGVEGAIRATAEALSVGASQLIHPLRLALTGVSKGPGLFELMAVLGKETSLRRIDRACAALG
jgi:glutamyl-tRNA synthetase